MSGYVAKTHKPRKCPECGREFVPQYARQVCCSMPCKRARQLAIMSAYNERRRAKRRVCGKSAECVVCGRKFISYNRRVTCSAACAAERYRQRNRDNRARQRDMERKQTAAEAHRAAHLAMRDREARAALKCTPRKVTRYGDMKVETRGNCTGGGSNNSLWQYIGVHA